MPCTTNLATFQSMWDFAALFSSLMKPALLLRQYLKENYVTVEEHHNQLQQARRAHSVDLVLVGAALDEEIHEAIQKKRLKLGKARGALDRASRALSKRHPR